MPGIFSPDVNFNIQPESPVAAVQPYTESAIASALSLGSRALGSVGPSSGTSSSVSPDQIKWYTEKLNVVAGISNSTQQELAWRKLQFEAGGNGIKLGDWSNSLDQSILGKTREQLVKGEEGAYRDFIEGDPVGQNARAAHLRKSPNDYQGAFNAARDAVEQRRALDARIEDMGSKDQTQRLELLPDVKARLYNFRDNGMLYLKNLIASGQPIDPALSNIVQGELARMISPLGDLTQYGQAGKDLQKEYEIILGGTTKLLDALGKADPSSRAMARVLQSMSEGGVDQYLMDLYLLPTNIVLGANTEAMIEARREATKFARNAPTVFDNSKILSDQVSQIFGRSLAGDLSVTGSDYPGVGLGIFNPESLAGVDALPAQARSANSNVIDLMVAATNPTKSPEDVKAFVDLSVTQALNSSYTGNGDFPSLGMLAKSFGPGFQEKLSQLPADEQQKVRVAVSASLDSNRRARVNEAESARNRFANGIGFDANRNQFTIDAKTLMDNVPDSTSKGAVNLFLQRLSKVYGDNGNDYTLAINKALEGKLRGLEDHVGAMRSLGITSMARYKTHSSAVTGLDKLLFQIGGSGEQYTPSSLVTDFNLNTNRNTPANISIGGTVVQGAQPTAPDTVNVNEIARDPRTGEPIFPAQDELAVEVQNVLKNAGVPESPDLLDSIGKFLKDLLIPSAQAAPTPRPTPRPSPPQGNVIDAIKQEIRDQEGFRSSAYVPTKGDVPTIGYGFTEGVKLGDSMTKAEAEQRLTKEVNKRLVDIRNKIPNFDTFPADVQVAMLSSWYRGSLSGSGETINLINKGSYAAAATEFLNNEEYKNAVARGRSGIRPRMEKTADAIRSLR
jgi:lysozyme